MKRDMRYYVQISGDQIRENCKEIKNLTQALVKEYSEHMQAGGSNRICLVASGSSYNAALTAQMYMESRGDLQVNVMTPHAFVYYPPKYTEESFLIFISQSGCSTNVIQGIQQCRKMGKRVVLLTGNPETAAAQLSDVVVEYGVGNETVDYVTLGYSTLVAFLWMFSLEASLVMDTITAKEYLISLAEIEKAGVANTQGYKAAIQWTKDNFNTFLTMDRAIIVGDGANMGTIREIALKFQETLKIPTVYYESQEFIHGPNMQLTPEYAVFFLGSGETSDEMRKIHRATAEITEHVFFISDKPGEYTDHDIFIKEKIIHELSSLAMVVPFQYMVADVTEKKNEFKCHPRFSLFEKVISCKTEDYEDVMKKKRACEGGEG